MSLSHSYDEMPYLSTVRKYSHPDTLAVVGKLMGLNPEPVTECRVLEIGCSTGGNLNAMAATLPNSQFVGIDLSEVQIGIAQRIAGQLGLNNVHYRAMSLTDFTPDEGVFDYIICHGVYSWVPPFVQEKIFEVCSKNLAPRGIAYVSFNTYPGWHLRMPAREIMMYFLRRVNDPKHRSEAARSFYNFVARSNPRPNSVYAQLLAQEAEILKDQPDYYLAHEHLDAENRPCYFADFMERATAHELQYLGNAEPEFRLTDLPEEARGPIEQISSDLIQIEQYIDMILGRTFRKALLCHADRKLNRAPETETVFEYLLSAHVKPKGTTPTIFSPAPETFVDPTGAEYTSNDPLTKAIFWKLWNAWPKAVPVPELLNQLQEQFGDQWTSNAKMARDTLAATILQGYLARTIALSTHLPEFANYLSEKPRAFLPARYDSQTQSQVPCVRHQQVIVSDLERYLLGHLDGSRTQADLVSVVEAALAQKLFAPPDGPVADAIETALKRLAHCSLLVG